jgi:PBSX family phage terminase large subunit
MSGGFGTGGTTALSIEMTAQSLMYPNNTGLLGRFDSVELEATTLVELFEVMPKEAIMRHDKTKRVIYLWNGSRIIYIGLDDAKNATNKIKSMNLGWACIDQLEEIDEAIFLALQGRLRRQHSERCFFAKCNPEGHNWAYQRWVKQPLEDYMLAENIKKTQANKALKLIGDAQRANVTLDRIMEMLIDKTGLKEDQIMNIYEKNQYEYFPAVTMDNIYLPPEYVNNLLSYPEKWKRRYVYNSWDNFEGLVYSEYKESVNLETAYIPEKGDSHIHGYDYGYRNPACVLYGAVDFDGVLHIYDEYYESEKLIEEQASAYKRNIYSEVAYKLADPSINKCDKDGTSVFDSWNEHGVWWQNANNDVRQGIDRVNQYLKEGRIKISKRCIHLREEIASYRWKQLKIGEEKNEYEEPVKKDDHAMDVLRYMINHIFVPDKIKIDIPARLDMDELYGGEQVDDTTL